MLVGLLICLFLYVCLVRIVDQSASKMT